MTATPRMILPVILSGGTGSRLWPVSRSAYPKQLLALTDDKTLLQNTVLRVTGEQFLDPLILCNTEHRFIIAEQLREIGVNHSGIVLEPSAKNTSAPICIASLIAEKQYGEDVQLLVLPSDHVIGDTAQFLQAIEIAAEAATKGALITFGIKPTHPETGYGYIYAENSTINNESYFNIQSFVEKPDKARATEYVQDGHYYWNSGMFLFNGSAVRSEFHGLQAELLDHCHQALQQASKDLDFTRLDPDAFEKIPEISFDYAIMESCSRGFVVPVNMGWNDIGSWSALWDIAEKDQQGNAASGDVMFLDSEGCFAHSKDILTTVVGLKDVVVVTTHDAVLVCSRDHAQHVKQVVEKLRQQERNESDQLPKVYRPWGFYQSIDNGERYQVKRLSINPGCKLSSQMHHHRSEHWVVVNGTAKVTKGEKSFLVSENESVYIPIGTLHRLENPGKMPLNLVEVQSGAYLGEDDIERFDDDYGRLTP